MQLPKRVVILGAGTSGLSVACGLVGKKNFEVTILESAQKIGGLSKTIEHNGIRFDIGPHRFSPQIPEIIEFVHNLLGSDLLKKKNIHGVYFNGVLYHYPPEVIELFNPISLRISFIFGIDWVWARFKTVIDKILKRQKRKSFEEILLSQFGKSFCKEVIFPMIYKVWGTKELHPDFAKIRFIKPTFKRIVGRVFLKNFKINDTVFYYPANGYGQIWDTLAEYLKKSERCFLNLAVDIDSIEAKSLNGPFKIFYTQGGIRKAAEADIIVSTISNRYLITYLTKTGLVNPVLPELDHFSSRTLRLGILVVKNFHLPARVVIFPESKFIFNRISEMNQFSNLGYPKGEAILMVDVICEQGSRYDIMEERGFNRCLLDSILMLSWFKEEDVCQNFSIRFPNAYPVLNRSRYNAQEMINRYFANSAILLCGREASSDYNNAHNAMCKGFFAARYISGEISLERYERLSRLIGRLPIQD